MKNWIGAVLFLLFQVFSITTVSYANDICLGNHQGLRKLSKQFDVMRKNDRDKFWAILLDAEARAANCNNISNISEFLKLANQKTTDVEFLEYYSEAVEKLCIGKPQEFKLAIRKLCDTQKTAVKSLLASPLYHDVIELQVCQ